MAKKTTKKVAELKLGDRQVVTREVVGLSVVDGGGVVTFEVRWSDGRVDCHDAAGDPAIEVEE